MQALFSEHWHLVRHLRPKLRDSVAALPRLLRGKQWVLLHDAFTQKFIRITPEAWQVIALMNGQRTLDEIWEMACAAGHGARAEHIVGQQDLVQMLGQLYSSDMLSTQMPADAQEMLARFRKQRMQRWKQSYLNPLSVKIPLFHPDKWFDRQVRLADVVFARPALIVWLAVVLPAVFLVWQHWTGLTENFSDRVLAAHNLFILWLTYPAVKAVHEWAHGLAVKAWRGSVREIGVLFILFVPVPYVDAGSSYRFASKWQRAAVAAAGIMAELLLGALAVYVWLWAEDGLVHALAFNVILIAGVSTLLVNGNPLMRYDGYYILTDVLEMPNLSQRAKEYWVYVSDRFLFGARDAKPPLGWMSERFWLCAYGLVAPIYRIAIMVSLIWFVAKEYFFFGVILALVSAWLTLGMPLGKAFRHVWSGHTLARYRTRALRRLYVYVMVSAACLCAIPLPFYTVQEGVVWLPEQAVVRAPVDGHIALHAVQPQQAVEVGAVLLALDNPQLMQDRQLAQERVGALQLQIRQVQPQDVLQVQILSRQLQAEEAKLLRLQQQVDVLTLRAEVAGYWYPVEMDAMQGRFVHKGSVVGYVAEQASDVVRVAVQQDDMELIESRLRAVRVRLATDTTYEYAAELTRTTPGGDFKLVSPALGIDGGGQIAARAAQDGSAHALDRMFDVDVTLAHPQGQRLTSPAFGQRAYVRFDLGHTPLAWQWFLRIKQLFLKELHV